jgi:uncharacterized protein
MDEHDPRPAQTKGGPVTAASADGRAASAAASGQPTVVGTQRLDPRIVRVWTAQGAISTAVPVALLAGIELVIRVAGVDLPWPPGIPALLALVVGGLLTWWAPRASYRHWSYELAEEALELRHGIMQRTHSAIPYWRVQYIDVQQGPIERALGLSRLVVHTAAASTDAQVPGIAADRAEALRRVLLARAGTGDAV